MSKFSSAVFFVFCLGFSLFSLIADYVDVAIWFLLLMIVERVYALHYAIEVQK